MQELEKQNDSVADVNEDLHDVQVLSDTDSVSKTPEMSEAPVESAVDYALVAAEDVAALKSEFPEPSEISDICELNNPLRYAALRDLGLSPAEAYLATAKRAPKRDNRAHLSAIRTVSYAPQGTMTESEMAAARELFSDISDAEIRKLYKKVNK